MCFKFIIVAQMLFLPLFISAQTEEENPTPLGISDKYSQIIKPRKLPSNFITPSFNNDSLYKVYNSVNLNHTNPEQYIGGFGQKFDDKWFKKSSSKIVLDTGTVWTFKASTLTGDEVGITLDSLILPQGAMLSYYYFYGADDIFSEVNGILNFDMTIGRTYSTWASKEIYIEYFEPKNMSNDFDFKITFWSYTFAAHMHKS